MNYIDGHKLKVVNLDNVELIDWESANVIAFQMTSGKKITWIYEDSEEMENAMNEIFDYLSTKDALHQLKEVI